MHTIYFAASIRGGREDRRTYQHIINHLGTYGKVLTEHVADSASSPRADKGLSERTIHNRDMAWLHQSGVIVAEVSVAAISSRVYVCPPTSTVLDGTALEPPTVKYTVSADLNNTRVLVSVAEPTLNF